MITADTLIADLAPNTDYHRIEAAGGFWSISLYPDGAVLADTSRGEGGMLPPHVVPPESTVGSAIDAARRARMAGRMAVETATAITIALMHGVTLKAPCYPPVDGVAHAASVGPHPDVDGYACVVDPSGVRVARQALNANRHDPRTEEDRGPFEAARLFIDLVGAASAQWALERARNGSPCVPAAPDL